MTYKFRGISTVTENWVYGSLLTRIDSLGELFIIEVQDKEPPFEIVHHHVKKETVGQLTNHENGFYVGDIVNYVTGNPKRYVNAVVEFGEYETYTHFNKDEGDVEEHIGFYINDGERKYPIRSLWIEKVGNIHEHPHLLNPASGQSGVNHMNNIGPNEQKQQEQVAAGQEATNDQVQATEQQAQEDALESAEEGTTEG